ncbi:FAD-dependent oxidoreductase, partial [bacterium]|nr:FAD-dependent oxidoreductase [bacterium]
ERMLMSILHSAVNVGAVVANYVEMVGFCRCENRIVGISAKDNLTGKTFKIDAQTTVNTCGPWVNEILGRVDVRHRRRKVRLSAAMNLVVNRRIFAKYAVGIWSKSTFKDSDAVVSKGSRLFFISPWRDRSLIGTTHVHFEGHPEDFRIREKDILSFLTDVNEAYPPAKIKREDITFFYGGLLPADDVQNANGDVRLLKSYEIIDHSLTDGIDGLISVIGVKYTTARDVAERTVNCLMTKNGKKPRACATASIPVFGGQIENFQRFLADEKAKATSELNENIIEHLIYNYGSEYGQVLKYADSQSETAATVDASAGILKAEVLFAVKAEMAQKLSDVVRRRTELGSAGLPSEEVLHCCVRMIADELSWSDKKMKDELAETKALYVPAQ